MVKSFLAALMSAHIPLDMAADASLLKAGHQKSLDRDAEP